MNDPQRDFSHDHVVVVVVVVVIVYCRDADALVE
jgi:hypothetical protein